MSQVQGKFFRETLDELEWEPRSYKIAQTGSITFTDRGLSSAVSITLPAIAASLATMAFADAAYCTALATLLFLRLVIFFPISRKEILGESVYEAKPSHRRGSSRDSCVSSRGTLRQRVAARSPVSIRSSVARDAGKARLVGCGSTARSTSPTRATSDIPDCSARRAHNGLGASCQRLNHFCDQGALAQLQAFLADGLLKEHLLKTRAHQHLRGCLRVDSAR